MNKKGFVLMETIVVIVVISVALLTIFSSYNKILRKTKAENKYDTSEYIYMTEYVKNFIKTKTVEPVSTDIYPCKIEDDNLNCDNDLNVKNYYENVKDLEPSIVNFNINGIYIISDINKFDKDVLVSGEHVKNTMFFNANMIDYIRKLDVGETDELIIVEYNRPAKNWDGTQKKDSNGKDLFETYIASLEWSL